MNDYYTQTAIARRRLTLLDEMSAVIDQLTALDLPAALRPMLVETVQNYFEPALRDLDVQSAVIEYLMAQEEKR